jgi:hypothetical protein
MREIVHIPKYAKSYVVLSEATNVQKAIVFVHGFGGKPTETWRDFQTLVDSAPQESQWWSGADLYFYSYLNSEGFCRRSMA